MAATNQQVQNWADQRTRPRAEQIRALYLACKDDKAAIGDVYANLTSGAPWPGDARTDGPPSLLTKDDLLAMNTFVAAFVALVDAGPVGDMQAAAGQYPIVLKACVRSPA